jgi:hypothetical protein
MKIDVLRELHEARPSAPFTLTLADGRRINVIHNEVLYFFPSGRAAIVTHPDDRFTLIDLPLVTSADVDPKFRTRPSKSRAEKS